ncbi:MAG TPA: VWA domain-containing protein [Acidimicrobiia bacterium]|nr:VWA domain-containing protein [Acidimicrobiia bacterium]
MRGALTDLTGFATALRRRGLTVTPDQVSDMARALTLVDPSRRSQVRASLRSLAITDPDQRGPFDEEFARFFEGLLDPMGRPGEERDSTSGAALKPVARSPEGHSEEETSSQGGTSATKRVATRDFADLSDDELAEARRMVMAMMWQPSDVRTRRWFPSRTGSRPDLRRSLRSTTRPEGDLIPIVRSARRKRQRPLIVIADISGSMEKYADVFLVFAHAAQRRIDEVEVFTFSTELTRITDDLNRRSAQVALDRVASTVHDWSGGTKIGDALATWNREWSRRLTRGGPIALILSDGWDCGDPSVLGQEMARLARTVHRVIWLNPLAAHAGYRPATRGMQAVLPHIDHLLPAASVVDLRGVVRLLDSMQTR